MGELATMIYTVVISKSLMLFFFLLFWQNNVFHIFKECIITRGWIFEKKILSNEWDFFFCFILLFTIKKFNNDFSYLLLVDGRWSSSRANKVQEGSTLTQTTNPTHPTAALAMMKCPTCLWWITTSVWALTPTCA